MASVVTRMPWDSDEEGSTFNTSATKPADKTSALSKPRFLRCSSESNISWN